MGKGSAVQIAKLIKRTVQTLAALWLLSMLFIGLGGTYFEHNPESGLAALGGIASVDREAGVVTQAGQFINGVAKTPKMVAELKREEAEDKANAEIERKQQESRRFNAGQRDYDDGYGAD